ncbi:MAG: glutaredoxin family protein [Actinomycetota bacterium]|nr:glutaredoxin family protein [Actinomycetota bacterium]
MSIVVFTRQGCPLCAEGIAIARSVFGGDGVALVDVDLDLELLERYTDRVPVIETEDGAVIDEGIISEQVIRAFRAGTTCSPR